MDPKRDRDLMEDTSSSDEHGIVDDQDQAPEDAELTAEDGPEASADEG